MPFESDHQTSHLIFHFSCCSFLLFIILLEISRCGYCPFLIQPLGHTDALSSKLNDNQQCCIYNKEFQVACLIDKLTTTCKPLLCQCFHCYSGSPLLLYYPLTSTVNIIFLLRYALGELVEAERDYINDLTELIDKLEAEDPKKFKNVASVASELKELAEFHRGLFLPDLTNCLDDPTEVADMFMKWVGYYVFLHLSHLNLTADIY